MKINKYSKYRKIREDIHLPSYISCYELKAFMAWCNHVLKSRKNKAFAMEYINKAEKRFADGVRMRREEKERCLREYENMLN